jgi:hypothetical protein
MRERWVPATIAVAVAVTALILIGIFQGSYSAQQADIDTMQQAIRAIPSAAGKAQADADARKACSYAAKITAMPPGDKEWVARNCLAGAVAPGSPYSSSNGGDPK